MTPTRWTTLVVTAVTAGALLAQSARPSGRSLNSTEYVVDGRVYGVPKAEVFRDSYDGPPVVGEIATRLPEVAPLAPGNRTHEVRVDALVQQVKVAPGVRYNAWTFGGTVPGPVLHVREGDRIVFTMKNRSDEAVSVSEPMREAAAPFFAQLAHPEHHAGEGALLPMPHSIDFHAAMMAPDDKYRMIRPGESIRFQWVANYPGVYMYHCGTPPVLTHVAMGQYGIVIVSPRDGYPSDREVAREYAVVQSEFYLKRGNGDLFVLDLDAAQRKAPSHVAFNGHTASLRTGRSRPPPASASVCTCTTSVPTTGRAAISSVRSSTASGTRATRTTSGAACRPSLSARAAAPSSSSSSPKKGNTSSSITSSPTRKRAPSAGSA